MILSVICIRIRENSDEVEIFYYRYSMLKWTAKFFSYLHL